MKKRILLFVLVLCILLAACGGGSAFDSAPMPASAPEPVEAPASAPDEVLRMAATESEMVGMVAEEAQMFYADDVFDSDAAPSADSESPAGGQSALAAAQIIHHASAVVQTLEFDDTIAQVYALIARYRGFIQQSYIGGQDLHAKQLELFAARRADFSIRVPAASYQTMVDALDSLGVISSLQTSATNVSVQHADISSRLQSLRVQEERILALLEDADNLSDLLYLESRLGSLIHQIELLTADRSHLDGLISYSTIELWIAEVEELTEEELSENTGFGAAFSDSLAALGDFLYGLVLLFGTLLPWLIAAAVLALALALPALMLRRHRKRKKAAAAAVTQASERTNAL